MSISLVYAIPDPNRSDAEARKRAHQDLRRLSDFGLWRELHRVDWLKRLDTATLAALLDGDNAMEAATVILDRYL